jgi:hypothetical protein
LSVLPWWETLVAMRSRVSPIAWWSSGSAV